jgi:hypothetical protein
MHVNLASCVSSCALSGASNIPGKVTVALGLPRGGRPAGTMTYFGSAAGYPGVQAEWLRCLVKEDR